MTADRLAAGTPVRWPYGDTVEDFGAKAESAWSWAEPPEWILGRTVPVAGALRSDSVAVHLPHVVAYPSGLVLPVRLMARRRSQSDTQWEAITGLIPRRDWESEEPRRLPASAGRPRFALSGERDFHVAAVLGGDDEPGVDSDPVFATNPPKTPVLLEIEADGAFGLSDISMNVSLWLVPLPPRGSVTFNVEWRDADFAGTLELDGAALDQAARESSPAWPEP